MFSNLKVLELASVLAGPGVGQFFAELGAEVIKIENIKNGGDVTRSWRLPSERATDDRSAYFCSVNWGKKSLAIDLTSAEGKAVLQKLAGKADIIIASYKPGDAEKLGVAYTQLKTINSSVIYGQISGYGADNDRVGYDAVIQAESGLMDMNGEKEGEALKMPVAMVDILAGHHLKEGLLLALLRRQQSGEGSCVEVSLLQAAIASLANQATSWLVAGTLPVRKGSLHPSIAPYGETFETADGKRIILAVGNDRQFNELCQMTGAQECIADERFITNQQRVIHRIELKKILSAKISQWNASDLMRLIHLKKIPAGLLQNVKDALEMPQVRELMLHHKDLSGVRSFIATDNKAWGVSNELAPPPHLGEHNEEIINSL